MNLTIINGQRKTWQVAWNEANRHWYIVNTKTGKKRKVILDDGNTQAGFSTAWRAAARQNGETVYYDRISKNGKKHMYKFTPKPEK